jgi:hypothetical protein
MRNEIDGINPLSQRPFIAVDDDILILMEEAKTDKLLWQTETRINCALKFIKKNDEYLVERGYRILKELGICDCHIPYIDKEFIDFVFFTQVKYKHDLAIETRDNIDFIRWNDDFLHS